MVSTRRTARQLDVFANPYPDDGIRPYLVVLQSDAVSEIQTRVVAPLVSPKTIKMLERMLPEVVVNGTRYTVAIPDMAAIPVGDVGEAVANLEADRYRIISAVDLVFTGI